MKEPHISLAAEKIGSILGMPITNSLLSTWLVMIFLITISLIVSSSLKKKPSKFQALVEIIIEGLHNLFKSVVGEHNVKAFFPLLATIFLFVIVGNWSGLLPGMGTVGFFEKAEKAKIFIPQVIASESSETITKTVTSGNESQGDVSDPAQKTAGRSVSHEKFTPLFRGPTADLNTTLAMALIAFFSLQYFGFKSLGAKYLHKYFNFSNPIMFFIGILEIISDLSKILSFAFRLFGNIFAGEVLLTVIAFLMPLVAPLPFLGLELFVGFIQALVFSMLTAVFLNMATVAHEEH